MADLTDVQREQLKMSYYELAPSLQTLINSFMPNNQTYTIYTQNIQAMEAQMNGIAFTIGNTRPANPTNAENLNLNTTDNVLEGYYNNAWNPRAVAFQ